MLCLEERDFKISLYENDKVPLQIRGLILSSTDFKEMIICSKMLIKITLVIAEDTILGCWGKINKSLGCRVAIISISAAHKIGFYKFKGKMFFFYLPLTLQNRRGWLFMYKESTAVI